MKNRNQLIALATMLGLLILALSRQSYALEPYVPRQPDPVAEAIRQQTQTMQMHEDMRRLDAY